MKTVLVTGAAGFLGSHLAKHHLDAGDLVHGMDDFTSSDRNSAHLKELLGYDLFDLVEHDITEPYKFDNKVDLIYNFACPASPPAYQSMPVHTMMTCVVGTERMLDTAQKHDAVLVHASTSEIYGDPEVSPQHEGYRGCVNSYGPRACYDEGKRAAEALCFDYRKEYGVDARLVRIFNTYGPHMDPFDGRVVSNFIRQALQGEPLTIYGHGQQTRSFCYVDDLIRGIVAMGELKMNPMTPINLGNPTEHTVHDLAEMIARSLNGGRLNVKPGAMPIDDPTRRKPDITLAGDLLDWKPRVSIEVGLEKTTEYFRKVLK